MQHASISELIEKLNKGYPGSWGFFGTATFPPDDSMGFRIDNVSASFSVSTHGGNLKAGLVDVQIECQLEEYIFTDEISVEELVNLIPIYRNPIHKWPLN